MSQHKEKSCKTEKIRNLKVKNLCVENTKSKNLTVNTAVIQDLTANNANIQNLNANAANISNLQVESINGINPSCRTVIENSQNRFDCMDCDITDENPFGNPIKPDNIDTTVWNFLMCNLREYQAQLQTDFRAGREQIRCIKKAYGCAPDCPPDCPPVKGCTGPCPEPPNCSVDPECIPDPLTCEQDVPNYLYATSTLFPYSFSECNSDVEGLTSISCDLNINNVSCNLATRVASIFVHYAYISTIPGPTGATGPCQVCPGQTGDSGLSCLCNLVEPDIVCGILQISCRQFGPTININLGEAFEVNILIPSTLIQNILESTSGIGAIQLAVFLEEGLEVSNNKSGRGGGPPPVSGNGTRTQTATVTCPVGENCDRNGEVGIRALYRPTVTDITSTEIQFNLQTLSRNTIWSYNPYTRSNDTSFGVVSNESGVISSLYVEWITGRNPIGGNPAILALTEPAGGNEFPQKPGVIASQSGNTITGFGSTFTPNMVGFYFLFANGSGSPITEYISPTELKVFGSQTVVLSQFRIVRSLASLELKGPELIAQNFPINLNTEYKMNINRTNLVGDTATWEFTITNLSTSQVFNMGTIDSTITDLASAPDFKASTTMYSGGKETVKDITSTITWTFPTFNGVENSTMWEVWTPGPRDCGACTINPTLPNGPVTMTFGGCGPCVGVTKCC